MIGHGLAIDWFVIGRIDIGLEDWSEIGSGSVKKIDAGVASRCSLDCLNCPPSRHFGRSPTVSLFPG